jgi:hypothetical protein
MKKAIAYVSDIILGRTGEVIKKSYQKELINQYATDNGIEIVDWFEDDMYNEDVIGRPGIQKLLACDKPYDTVLVERIWAFSRSMPVLEGMFKEIDRRGVKVEAATTMWDCVSQQCRYRYKPEMEAREVDASVVVRPEEIPARVKKPARLHFLQLMKHA